MKVFLSYSHRDHHTLDRLHIHLTPLIRAGLITAWYDRDILAGSLLISEIERQLDQADLFIALVSPDFLASNYCYEQEMQRAIERHQAGQLRILPIIIEPCDWAASPLRAFKALPKDGQPVSEWLNTNSAFNDVIRELRRLIDISPLKPIILASKVDPIATHSVSVNTSKLPLAVFPEKIERFMENSVLSSDWAGLDYVTRLTVSTLGTKLEPVVQMSPITPTPAVLGFECLALGALGQNFGELAEHCSTFDPGALRICLSIAAMETINALRNDTATDISGVGDLKFSLNLDPPMLDSPLLKPLLRQYRLIIQHNVLFEINETTSEKYLHRLKNLQVDFDLRFSADDLNAWSPQVRSELIGRVEMTKMDQKAFHKAMEVRGENPALAIRLLRENTAKGKPLVVEGVSDADFLDFLRHRWDPRKYGQLHGQGYHLEAGLHWERAVLSLKGFGLPGGSMLRLSTKRNKAGAMTAHHLRAPASRTPLKDPSRQP